MQNWKSFLKPGDWAIVIKHATLLTFAFSASLVFCMMGFINHHQIPVAILITFLSVELMQFQQSRRPSSRR